MVSLGNNNNSLMRQNNNVMTDDLKYCSNFKNMKGRVEEMYISTLTLPL